MPAAFAVHLEPPRNGRLRITLRAGQQSLELFASHAPTDAMRELVEALVALSHDNASAVTFNTEPERFAWTFAPRGDAVELEVKRYADHRMIEGREAVVLSVTLPRDELLWTFWRALRALMGGATPEDYRLQLRHELPEQALRALGVRLVRAGQL